jgi:stage II sporulation protein R
MKKLITSAAMILIATVFIAAIPTEAEGAIYEDTVRLHILANSDSDADQELKLRLRDAILAEFGRELSVFESTEEATSELMGKLEEIRKFCDGKLSDYGSPYKTGVTLSEEWYDTREYGSFTLPKGYYTSLRVIIGEGGGKNWWCVMFPPLCLDAAVKKHTYTDREEILITKKYNIKFKILELISEIAR